MDKDSVLTFTKNNGKTNFKHWSFRLFIYLIILNILIVYSLIKTPVFGSLNGKNESLENLNAGILIFSILSFLLLIVGVILTVLSMVNKEERNYQFYVSIIGYPVYIVAALILTISG